MPIVEVLVEEVLPRVAWIGLFITVGVGAANLAVEFGAIRKIAHLSRPLTQLANLPDEVGTAILTTTVSPTAGYGMLADFRESDLLDDQATLVTIVINTFFGYLQHIFTYFVPILIPIVGVEVGIMYVGGQAAISLATTLVGITAGALFLSDQNIGGSVNPAHSDLLQTHRTRGEKLRDAVEGTVDTLKRILPRLVVVYALVVVLMSRYDLTELTSAFDPVVAFTGLPSASIPVIAVLAIDLTGGAITIAPMINEVFTPHQAVATMFVGSLASLIVFTIRTSIPFQYGIWGPAFGTKVVVVNAGLRAVFLTIAVGLLLIAL